MNKTKLSTLLIAFLAISGLVGCNQHGSSSSSSSDSSSSSQTSSSSLPEEDIYISEVSVKSATDILLGSTEQLSATFTPANATKKDLVWSSEDESIATVSQTGLVTAKKVGKTNIVVQPKDVKGTVAPAKCAVTVKDNVVLSSVTAKHEFVLFDENRKKDEKNDDGFYDHEQTYKVGDDNLFNVKPELTVLDAVTYQKVSASRWLYDFTITAKLGEENAGTEYFSVIDARNCDVQFTSAAVGKTFTISVAPGGVDASRVAALTKTFTVDVVDGFNVYDPVELGYFDTRVDNDTIDAPIMENNQYWQCKWTTFKAENGLSTDYTPASLIFHTDIAVTPSDLPTNFFYTKAEAQALNDPKAEGSLVDFTYLYERTIPGDITIDGNYFGLDFSAIPLIKRDRCETTDVGGVVGHSAAFKAIAGGNIIFRNINMTGNAKNAADDNDKIYGGGIMFVKGAGSDSLKAYNMIATKFFITFFGEKAYIEGNPFTKFELDKVKCFNNYNSFMYNWGSIITASNSLFRSCGGPVIIQDHAGTDDYEANNGLTIFGYAPTTNFIDCTIKNYVTGSEAWFQQFNATSVTPKIKMLSDLLYATGITKSFVSNDKHEGKLYTALSAEGKNAFFNFIVLNKSGRAEGMTAFPACGTVNITESEKTTTFNYRQPNTDPAGQAYLAYMAAPAEEQQAAFVNLITEMSRKGYSFAPDYSDAEAKITAYITALCTPHGLIRGLNSNEAPVYDFGEGYDLLSISSASATYLQTAANVAAGGSDPYVPSSDDLANLPNYMSLYYNGMALVMELTPYVA